MKNVLLIVFFIVATGAVAQTKKVTTAKKKSLVKTAVAPYKRKPIPPFTMYVLPDSSKFTTSDLPKGKPVVFIVFSPECHHCKIGFDNLIRNIDFYKDACIVLNSFFGWEVLKKFYEEKNIGQYPNMILGFEPNAVINNYFDNRLFPGVYVYDKQGKFKGECREDPDFAKIAEFLQ